MIKLSEMAEAFLSMAGGESTLCKICKHIHYDGNKYTRPMKCDAFPKGIPQEGLDQQRWHLIPRPGDNGIMFEEMHMPEEIKKLWDEKED